MNAEMRINTGDMNFSREEIKDNMDPMEKMKEMNVVSEKCNCSVYSMVTVAGGIIMAIGTVIYSLITM